MSYTSLDISNTIATITLNRPEYHNAINADFILAITQNISAIENNHDITCLIINAAGENFCAGADLVWMKDIIHAEPAEHEKDSKQFATLLQKLHSLTIPTICVVHGKTYGGGLGLIATCDIVIAQSNSKFCFSEAKLGLIPAMISPFIVQSIGARSAKKLFLTAELFDARQAMELGLIHYVSNDTNATLEQITKQIKSCSPNATFEVKKLFQEYDLSNIDNALMEKLAKLIAKLRVSNDAQKGMSAFLNKQPINWNSK